MPSITVNGADLYYEAYGDGELILGIHGTPSSARLWEDAAQRLADRGRCIIYDRRGFGRSRPPGLFETVDLADHVDDAAALLDALAEGPAAVIGRSTGGQIALELARRVPEKVRALVLLEPALFTVDTQAAAWAERLRHGVLQHAAVDPSSASETVIRVALGDGAWESLPDDLKDLFTAASPAVLAEVRGTGLDLSAQPLTLSSDDLAAIGQPALLVSSEDSPEALRRVNARLAEVMPQTEAVLVPGGHLIDPAHPSVLDFLARTVDHQT
jgi:pimeloyl-ACP methyl ester carboxylesterase